MSFKTTYKIWERHLRDKNVPPTMGKLITVLVCRTKMSGLSHGSKLKSYGKFTWKAIVNGIIGRHWQLKKNGKLLGVPARSGLKSAFSNKFPEAFNLFRSQSIPF